MGLSTAYVSTAMNTEFKYCVCVGGPRISQTAGRPHKVRRVAESFSNSFDLKLVKNLCDVDSKGEM